MEHDQKRERNKHHLLYPERAFTLNENNLKLREFFVVSMPMYLHNQLHNELDALFSVGNDGFSKNLPLLPDQKTLDNIYYALERDKETILGGEPTEIQLLDWLDDQLPDDDRANWWMIMLVRVQKMFYVEHAEEMRPE